MRSYPGGIAAALAAQRSAEKRILWVAGNSFPDIGGAEASLHANLCLLKGSAGQILLTGTKYGHRVIDGIPIVESELEIEEEVASILQWYEPQYIGIQGSFAKRVLESTQNFRGLRSYFLRAQTSLPFERYLQSGNFQVVANSGWMADWFQTNWGVRPLVFLPVVIPWMVVATERIPRYVTHVGDVQVKGGGRVWKIAESMPTTEFLVTKSWPALRSGRGWDSDKIRDLQETEGSITHFEHNPPDFSRLENVRFTDPFLNVRGIYFQTKVLLFASTWKEPFGRTVVEALLNKLPVIISPEAFDVRWEGLVYPISDGDDIEEWADTISTLLTRGHDPERLANIEQFCERYDLEHSREAISAIFSKG